MLNTRFNIKSQKVPTQIIKRKEKIADLRKQQAVEPELVGDENSKNKKKQKKAPKPKKIFVIDKSKLEDNFALVTHSYDKIPEKRLRSVLREYVLFDYWRFWDIFTVFLDIVWVGLITLPTLLISISNESAYARYSLNDPYDLIQFQEIKTDPGTVYLKILYQGWTWNMVLTIIIIIFWVVSFIDLIIYYKHLTFPMDDTFRKTELLNRNCLQKFGRILEWILLLCALSFYFGYIGLLGVWWLLAAIISPTAFLPYASGAVTFLTFVRTKYAQF